MLTINTYQNNKNMFIILFSLPSEARDDETEILNVIIIKLKIMKSILKENLHSSYKIFITTYMCKTK